MIVLGIDPGTERAGYGVVEKAGSKIKLIAAGLLKVKSKGPEGLLEIKTASLKIIKKFHPEMMAIEKLFFAKNQKTALRVAEARGVLLTAAAESGLKIKEYGPNEVKAGITGYGFADKKAVLKMVRLMLKEPDLEVIDDASDALALAILGASDIHT
ncbi:MAG: crossover junction endodeoxyribonuclease RuvC [Patescibacteria group bacterium]